MAKNSKTIEEMKKEPLAPRPLITVEKAPGKYRLRRYDPDGKVQEKWAKDPFSMNQDASILRGKDTNTDRVDIDWGVQPQLPWMLPRHEEEAIALARKEEMVAALKQAAMWFQEYADHHMAKDPPDKEKADRNQERANHLMDVVAGL